MIFSHWILALLSVCLVSLVSLAGLLTLSMNEARVRRVAELLIGFAVGALLGDAFIHLLPQAFARDSATLTPSRLALAGMVGFFVAEKLLRHRHGVEHVHSYLHARVELAGISMLGDTIHNFIDGVLIGSSYLVSPTLGVSTNAAVVLHELPQELGDFGILVHSGLRVRTALLFNLASPQSDHRLPAIIVVGKQIFATHYIEAGLGLMMVVTDAATGAPYLAYINRSQVDILRGFFGRFLRGGFEDRVTTQAPQIIRGLRTRLESGAPPEMDVGAGY